jgi:S1-C subfamily serine protease
MTGWDAGSAGINPERVAELLVDLGGARPGRRGSGYRVSASAVLTTAHVVRDAAQVRVRFNADRPGEWLTDGTVAWSDPTVDAAVVTISPDPRTRIG